MITLSLEQIIQQHVMVIRVSGGSRGIRDLGRLEAVVAGQTQEFFGRVAYAEVIEKSAALMRGIITGHPFVDGNKRTGILAGLTLLEQNGRLFVAEQGEIEDFAVRIATEKLEVADIARWLSHHSTA